MFKLTFLKKKVIVKNKIFQVLNSKFKKKIKRNLIFNLKIRFLLIKKKVKKELKTMIFWIFLNLINLKFLNFFFWKNWIVKNIKNKVLFFRLKLWPKKDRKSVWYIFNKFYANFKFFSKKKKKYSFNEKKSNSLFFFSKVRYLSFSLSNKYVYFQWKFINKKKKLSIKKKLIRFNRLYFINWCFKENFKNIFFQIYLKHKFSSKKYIFFKSIFNIIYKSKFFKKWFYSSKLYFLSFIFLIWYKNIYFLGYFLWTRFFFLKNKEKSILKRCFFFFNNVPLRQFGILGWKILIKGKLFKRPRKKVFLIKKGDLPLLNPSFFINYSRYFITTRAGAFSFHFWLTFIK